MSTVKTANLQHPDAASAAITLAADGTASVVGGPPTSGQEYLMVYATGTASENGAELAAAYSAAKAMTPYGSPLADDNRATVLVAPGDYDFGVDTTWEVDGDFVNVLSLDGTRSVRITTTHTSFAKVIINVTADNAYLRGIDVGSGRFDGCAGPSGTGASGLLVKNCAGGNYSFGYDNVVSGEFVDCVGGSDSFGASGTASGVFRNCSAGNSSFAAFGDAASGVFTDCSAGTYSFGSFCAASGTFIRCTAGGNSFGLSDDASGVFVDCTAGDNSFAYGDPLVGGPGTASGTFENCTAGVYSYGNSGTASGTFINCYGSDAPFNGSTFSGNVLYCRSGNVFPDPNDLNVTFTGKIRLSLDGNLSEVNEG